MNNSENHKQIKDQEMSTRSKISKSMLLGWEALKDQNIKTGEELILVSQDQFDEELIRVLREVLIGYVFTSNSNIDPTSEAFFDYLDNEKLKKR